MKSFVQILKVALMVLHYLPSLSIQQVVDLTYPFDDNTLHYPTHNKFNHTIIVRGNIPIKDNEIYLELNDFEQSEHVGTHMDAPSHVCKGKWRTHQIPIER